MEIKFKVGDTITIKHRVGNCEDYPFGFCGEMASKAGKKFVIKDISDKVDYTYPMKKRKYYNGDDYAYYLEGDDFNFLWHSSMFVEGDLPTYPSVYKVNEYKQTLNLPCIHLATNKSCLVTGIDTSSDLVECKFPEDPTQWIHSNNLCIDFRKLFNIGVKEIEYNSPIFGKMTITPNLDSDEFPILCKLQNGEMFELTIDGKYFNNPELCPIT